MQKLLLWLNISLLTSFGFFGVSYEKNNSLDNLYKTNLKSNNNINNYNLQKNINNNENLKEAGYDPLYPSFTLTPNTKTKQLHTKADSGWSNDSDEISYSVNINKYSSNETTFINNYNLAFNGSVYEDWDDTINNQNTSTNVDLNSKTNSYISFCSNHGDKKWHGWSSSYANFNYLYMISFTNDLFKISIKTTSYTDYSKMGNFNSYSSFTLNSLVFTSRFNVSTLRDKAENAFNDIFNMLSLTSLDISDKNALDFIPNNAHEDSTGKNWTDTWNSDINLKKSNIDRIKEYIVYKLKLVFLDDYDAWFNYNEKLSKTLFNIAYQFNDDENTVHFLIQDTSHKISSSDGFTKTIDLKVNVIKSKYLEDMNNWQKIQFKSNKVLNINKPETLTDDFPEWNGKTDKEGNLGYHNTLNLTMNIPSKNKINQDWDIYVNNKKFPEQDKDHIAHFNSDGTAKLKLEDPSLFFQNDKLNQNKSNDVNYKIELKQSNTDIKDTLPSFNINIKSVQSLINFKMAGWDSIKNDTDKEWQNKIKILENEGLDLKTGIINQNLGINLDKNNNYFSSFPFPFDPLNEKGIPLKTLRNTKYSQLNNQTAPNDDDTIWDQPEYAEFKPKPFYLAQGCVINSLGKGIEDSDIINPENIDTIEIQEVNALTFESVSNPIILFKEGHISKDASGHFFGNNKLYHFVIHLKNWVSHDEIGGKLFDNPTSNKNHLYPDWKLDNAIEAKSGSTVHQFVLLKNEGVDISKEDYSTNNFSFTKTIEKNENCSELFNTISGQHLFYFLKNEAFKNEENKESLINNLTFTQLNSYWLKYVSEYAEEKAPIQPPVNLTNLKDANFAELKMNTNISGTDPRQLIEEDVRRKMKSFVLSKNPTVNKNDLENMNYKIKVININWFDGTKRKNEDINSNNDNESYNFSDFSKLIPEKSDSNVKQVAKNYLTIEIDAPNTSLILEHNTSTKMKVMNNSDFDPSKVLNLSQINIEPNDIKYNFFLWEKDLGLDDKQRTKDLQNNYIYYFVDKYLKGWKNEKFEGEYVLGVDYHISIQKNYGKEIDKDGDSDITEFMNSNKENSIKIYLYSDDQSLLLEGSNSYTLTNDPAGEVPPDFPPIPPFPNDDKPSKKTDNSDSIAKKSIFWILMTLGFALLGLGVYATILIKRKHVKRIK